MQHLDHEIKELNESNLKIEADMMQLQTQVSINTKELATMSNIEFRHIHFDRILSSPKADLVDGMQPEDN